MSRPEARESPADAALIEAARNGDVASYGRLVERYQTVAHRTAFALGAGDDAADVVQEAFVKAFVALDRFRAAELFRPWLLKIVVNETRNRWRWSSKRRTVPLPLVGEDPSSSARTPEQVAEDRETTRLLRDAVVALPPNQRDVVICRYLLDLSEAETAQALGIPSGTVKSRLSRGLAALETVLAPIISSAGVEAEPRHG
ncbi:MAG TPA: RNA polymerase sigma factor [Jiangellaceae bacterium]|jgi:RNA polymerase sigma-70 factor (ECF subfamily)|nr:RNA polymerase sigma factor [Jiangellaceae bacterium]